MTLIQSFWLRSKKSKKNLNIPGLQMMGKEKSFGVPKFSLKNLSIRGQGQTSFDKLRQVFSQSLCSVCLHHCFFVLNAINLGVKIQNTHLGKHFNYD